MPLSGEGVAWWNDLTVAVLAPNQAHILIPQLLTVCLWPSLLTSLNPQLFRCKWGLVVRQCFGWLMIGIPHGTCGTATGVAEVHVWRTQYSLLCIQSLEPGLAHNRCSGNKESREAFKVFFKPKKLVNLGSCCKTVKAKKQGRKETG